MNIIEITDETWDSGITNYALILSAGLKRRGHNVVFVGLEDKPPVIQAKKIFLNVRFIKSRRDILRFIRIIEEEKIDLINAHTGSSHVLAVVSLLFAARKLKVVRTRGDVRPPKDNLLTKLLYFGTSKFIAAAEFIKNMYKDIGICEEKLITIYQGIDIDKFSSQSKLHSSLFSKGNREKRIGIVGRLDPVKGHFGFLKAMALVREKISDIEVLVVGKEENVKEIELKHLAKDLSIQRNILFIGYTKNVPEIMANCAIGVISSVASEATSRVLLEWMAAGKPVVATKIGVIPEIVQDGGTGFLVSPDNPQEMADKIVFLLQNKDRLESMQTLSRKLIEEKFSEEIFIEKTEQVYKEMLANKTKNET